MTRYRRNWKPCLLCEESTRDWDYICGGCRADVVDGAKMRKWREESDAVSGKEPERAYVLPRPAVFYYSSVQYNKTDRVDIDSLPKETIDVLLELLSPAPASSNFSAGQQMSTVGQSSASSYFDSGRFPDRTFSFKAGQPALLNKLLQLIRRLSLHSYLKGKATGESFVIGLVNDEVSIDDLIKRG